MPIFDSAGVPIHYEVFGEGRPIVLVHGFAASLQNNWVAAGWIETLRPLRRVIALDCRGHGESGKPHDPAAYGDEVIDDVVRLMDHLKIDTADLFGYSMGGRISLGLMTRYPERFTSVVLGGVGADSWLPEPFGAPISEALLAEDPATVTDPVAKRFREVAEQRGNDLKALGALRKGFWHVDREALATVSLPVLIVVGEDDKLARDPDQLVQAIPTARLITFPDRDHLTVVPDQRFKDAVVKFLSEVSAPATA